MLSPAIIIGVAAGYLGLLFGIAWFGDRRAEQGRSLISNGWVYALSSAVYCTAWTFYGSVGKAASSGIGFLPIYLGPTLAAAVSWILLRKMVRIAKRERITSIADLVASRYGKSRGLGALVTVIAVVGIVPYISLQLKAVSTSLLLLVRGVGGDIGHDSAFQPTTIGVAATLALFAILFGTRDVDLTARHEGMVLAIAFESVVKLVAFLAVGLWVTFTLFDGPRALFEQAAAQAELAPLLTTIEPWPTWTSMVLLALSAILFLPRQFQLTVVECVDERHVRRLSWLLPLYLFTINLFVLPIALAGRLQFPAGVVDADTFVLSLPIADGRGSLALLVFLGGLSAATGMIIVESLALATMVSNDLILPLLLRSALSESTPDLGRRLIFARRVAIVGVLALGQLYLASTGASGSLVSIGLVSFAAVAQLAPAILGGLYWRGATRRGALSGLISGFLVWGYTLPLPTLVATGWLPADFIEHGPLGIGWLRPHALFGLATPDAISHSLLWSLLFNVGAFAAVSALGRQSVVEHGQAQRFVDALRVGAERREIPLWRPDAPVASIRSLLERFLGPERTDLALASYGAERGVELAGDGTADAELVAFAERLLAGTTGAASARLAVATVASEHRVSVAEILHLLDETSHVIATSRALEDKSHQLEAATEELRAANRRLRELDQVKDDFLATMAHELRTPLTSIRAFTEILHDNPHLDTQRRREFLAIVLGENERLTRLVEQVLDLAKVESGEALGTIEAVDPAALVRDAIATASSLAGGREVVVETTIDPGVGPLMVNRDRMLQVLLNLLSNALRFCRDRGWIGIQVTVVDGTTQLSVADDGPGVPEDERETIFDRFRQVARPVAGRTHGTGLGLSIARGIVEAHGGNIWVETGPRGGARFVVELPQARHGSAPRPALAPSQQEVTGG